jgi:hypothetical protein
VRALDGCPRDLARTEPAPRLVWRGRIPRQGLRTALTWSL